MPLPPNRSKAFVEYLQSRREVIELLHAAPDDSELLRSPGRRDLANALYRGSVVLLSSHLEKYIESLAVEAIDAINAASLVVDVIPERLRLVQIETALNGLFRNASREREAATRINSLRTFMSNYVQFWGDAQLCGKLIADDLIGQFGNPLPEEIVKLFRHFGINDVVNGAVTSRQDGDFIRRKVRELVEKRNAIAHTGMTTDLTREDVVIYLYCSRRLVRGIDLVVGQTIQQMSGDWPWKELFLPL